MMTMMSSYQRDRTTRKRERNSECLHPMTVFGYCPECELVISKEEEGSFPTIPLRYIAEGLELSVMGMIDFRCKQHQALLSREKLCLLLDLDGTLLHSVAVDTLTKREQHLSDLASSGHPELFLTSIGTTRLTKLRPGVRRFLKNASQLFDLYVYTKATAAYAKEMVKRLDPNDEYFGLKVISREDMIDKSKKTLDVLTLPENVVVIFDDTEAVWSNHTENLIVAKRYSYFAGRDGPSPSMAEKREFCTAKDGFWKCSYQNVETTKSPAMRPPSALSEPLVFGSNMMASVAVSAPANT